MNCIKISEQALKLGLTPEDIEINIIESANNGYKIKTLNRHKEPIIDKLREFVINKEYKKPENKQFKNNHYDNNRQVYKRITIN